MKLRLDRALALLDECTGDDLWSVEHCRLRRVPEAWIEELADAYETSYRVNSQTIYVADAEQGQRIVNQYHGVRDIDLAKRIAGELGIDVQSIVAMASSRRRVVELIKEALME